ncbi:MAG: hypothetical protein AAFO69_13600 [Bacteroidota bacterium]
MKLILDKPTTKLFYSSEDKIVMGKMRGDISFQDYKEMLLTGAELAKKGKIDKIILDRRYITKQDAECRTWVKNYYIKKHVKPLVPSIRKVAIIESQTIVGKIYGKTILATLSLFYPTMKMKSFDELEDGLDWMTAEKLAETVVEDLLIDESSFFEDIEQMEKEAEVETVEEVAVAVETGDANSQEKSNFLQKLLKYFLQD